MGKNSRMWKRFVLHFHAVVVGLMELNSSRNAEAEEAGVAITQERLKVIKNQVTRKLIKKMEM